MSVPIRLMVSDVDGTLVTPDKQLTPATIAAVQRLRAANIAFTVVSSRPPRGLSMLVEPLGLAGPVAAFNGGMILKTDLTPIATHVVDAGAARIAIDMLRARNVDVWLFTDRDWFITDPEGAYVPREKRTVLFDPTVVANFDALLGRAGKIVGSTRDFALLEDCENALQAKLGDTAAARRSQTYYLDVTPAGADKGSAVVELARSFGVLPAEVAVIGDMANDVPMFEKAGLAIAMGNATDAVKAKAHVVTEANTADGIASAIERYILPRAG